MALPPRVSLPVLCRSIAPVPLAARPYRNARPIARRAGAVEEYKCLPFFGAAHSGDDFAARVGPGRHAWQKAQHFGDVARLPLDQ
jgi:hypothetical protein